MIYKKASDVEVMDSDTISPLYSIAGYRLLRCLKCLQVSGMISDSFQETSAFSN